MAGPVRISILSDGSRARRDFDRTGTAAGRMGSAFRSAARVGAIGVAGLAAGVTAFAAVSIKSVQRIERIGKQTDSVLKSTGNVAGTTRAQIDELAGSLEAMTATEAESITEGANMLLTFTNIRNESGRNNDVFDQSVRVLTDMTRAFDNTGGVVLDTRKQAIQLGKALNDPIKGVTALSKVGVSFTEQQKKTIASLVEGGDTMKAQKIILAELTKEFGGSGEAFAATTTGKIELAKHEIGTLGETIVGGLLPPLGELATRGTEGLRWATSFADSNIAPKVGRLADYVRENKDEVVDFAQQVAGRVLPVLDELGQLAVDTGTRVYEIGRPIVEDVLPALGLLVDGAGDVIGVLNDLPGPVKDFGVQVGIAALALGPLRAGITLTTGVMARGTAATVAYYSALRYGAGSSAAAARGAAGLASAAKTAAGIGGILALTSSLTKAKDEGNSFGSVMTGVAGGAGIGAMFGPVGALIGAGVGGGLSALVGSFAETREEAREARLELLRTQGFENAREDAKSLRDALRGVVDAYSDTTRAAVEASFTGKDGKLDADVAKLRELGVSMDTIVSATLGQRDAQELVTRSLDDNIAALEAQTEAARQAYETAQTGRPIVNETGRVVGKENLSADEVKVYREEYERLQEALDTAATLQGTFTERTEQAGGALEDRRKQIRDLAETLGITSQQYLRFPSEVRTDFEARGLPQTASSALRLIGKYKELQTFGRIRAVVSAPGVDLTRGQINRLAQQYRLTPKQVKTLVKAEGVRATVKDVDGIGKAIGRTSKTKVDLSGASRAVRRGLGDMEITASKGGREIKENIERPLARVRPNLTGVAPSVRNGLAPAKSSGRSGGVDIGANIKSGFSSGFSGADGLWSGQVRGAVRSAISAGRNEAGIASPSRETAYIGDMMGRGLENGLARRLPQAKRKGRDLVTAALAGVTLGSDGVTAAVGKVRSLIEKQIARDLKDAKADVPGTGKGRSAAVVAKEIKALEKASKARQTSILKGLRDEFTALRRNGAAQDRNSAALAKARDRYKSLVAEAKAYAAAVKESFVNYGSVIALGQGDGFANSTQLIDQLRARVDQAERFAALIRSFRDGSGPKLNSTTIQQLLDAGPEAALGTAEAIAAGGSAAITEINALTSDLANAGASLGTTMANQFKGAGIQAAAGLVEGLEKEQRRLDSAAARIGRQIVRAIRRELGIKSPSRVFRKVGQQTMDGLALGLDETYAARLGANVGRGVERGFKRPTLTADFADRAAAADRRRGGQAEVIRVELELTAQQGADLMVGKRLIAHIDYARSKGVRSEA